MASLNNLFDSPDIPFCASLQPSFLTHSLHTYPYISTPNTIAWVALERQRLRRLSLCGQNDYPYSFNVTRAFKGLNNDLPVACSNCNGQADWRNATGNVKHPTHKHPLKNPPEPPLRLPTICDGGFCSSPTNCQSPRMSASKNMMTPPAKSLVAPVNPEMWRTNFYVPFSTLEPRPAGSTNSTTDMPPASPRRQRLDVPAADLVRWQTFSLQNAMQKQRMQNAAASNK